MRGGDLPERASVVVVGGGVMGTSIAFHLAEAGMQGVVLLERETLAAGSTSKAAGGRPRAILRPAEHRDGRARPRGVRRLRAATRAGHRPAPGGLPVPPHHARGRRDLRAGRRAAELPRRAQPDARAAEIAALVPILRTDDILAAAFHPGDGYCSPESVVLGYATGARRHGATVLTGVELEGIETRAPEGGAAEIVAVLTSAGRVETSTVVCAAGAWSASVGAMAGVDLPVVPLRRQVLVTEPLSDQVAALVPPGMPMTIDFSTTFYLHPEGPGILLGMSDPDESRDSGWTVTTPGCPG
jgi:sarcosine oxidase subunit beta